MTWCGSASSRTSPLSIQIARSQNDSTAPRSCVTSTSVLPAFAELEHAVDAARLEALVADRQHLVDQQHVRVDVHGDREAEAGEHAARVRLDGVVGEALELGEGDDVVDPLGQIAARDAVDRAAQVDVLDRGVLGVEAGSDLEQRRDAAVDRDAARVGLDDAREQLEQRRLAGAVAADDADGLAVRDLERDAVERRELVVDAAAAADDRRLQRRLAAPVDAVALLGARRR